MKVRSIITALAATALASGAAASPALAINPTPEPPMIIPVDGAHWQAGVGLSDPSNSSALGLVQQGPTTADTHVLVASLKHLPATLTEIGLTSQTPSGIDPCWKVGVVSPDGQTFTLHLTTDSATVTAVGGTGGDFAPFFQWTWNLNIPAGDHISSATAEVMTDQAPSQGGQVVFDEFTVNGQTISHQ